MKKSKFIKEYEISFKNWESSEYKEKKGQMYDKETLRSIYGLTKKETNSIYNKEDEEVDFENYEQCWRYIMSSCNKKDLSKMLNIFENDKEASEAKKKLNFLRIIKLVNDWIDAFVDKVQNADEEVKIINKLRMQGGLVPKDKLITKILDIDENESAQTRINDVFEEIIADDIIGKPDLLQKNVVLELIEALEVIKLQGVLGYKLFNYISDSILDVFQSSFILPDVLCILIMQMVIDTPPEEIKDFPGYTKKKWKSFKNHTSDYLDYKKKYIGFTEDDEKKLSDYKRKSIQYRYVANPYFHKMILSIYDWGKDNNASKELFLYGKTKGGYGVYSYKQVYTMEEGLGVRDEMIPELDKIIIDMLENRLVGQRYAMGLTSVMYLYGRDEKYITKMNRNPVLGDEICWVKGRESEYRANNFIANTTKLPIYWQERFWNMLKRFGYSIKDYENRIYDKLKQTDLFGELNVKQENMLSEEFFNILARILERQFFKINTIYNLKCNIIETVLQHMLIMEVLSKDELNNMLKCMLKRDMLSWVKEIFGNGTYCIWKDMIDVNYCQRVDQDILNGFFIKTTKNNYSSSGNRVTERALGKLYSMIGSYFLVQNR